MMAGPCKDFLCGLFDSVRFFWKAFCIDKISNISPKTGAASASTSALNDEDQQTKHNLLKGGDNQHHSSPSPHRKPPVWTTLRQRREKTVSKVAGAVALQRTNSPRSKAALALWRCVGLNLLCILVINFIFLPSISLFVQIIHFIINYFDITRNFAQTLSFYENFSFALVGLLQMFWILPMFTITRLVNAIWYQDIANAAARKLETCSVNSLPFSRSLADFFYSILLETIFLMQTNFVGCLPIPLLNTCLKFLHLSLLYALYAFEYSWMSRGITLNQRLIRIQANWPYYFGFGFWLSLATSMCGDVFFSGCLFGVCFPFLIVSSFEVDALAKNGRAEEHFWSSTAAKSLNGSTKSLQVNDIEDLYLPVFAPSVYISDRISRFILNRACNSQRIKK